MGYAKKIFVLFLKIQINAHFLGEILPAKERYPFLIDFCLEIFGLIRFVLNVNNILDSNILILLNNFTIYIILPWKFY